VFCHSSSKQTKTVILCALDTDSAVDGLGLQGVSSQTVVSSRASGHRVWPRLAPSPAVLRVVRSKVQLCRVRQGKVMGPLVFLLAEENNFALQQFHQCPVALWQALHTGWLETKKTGLTALVSAMGCTQFETCRSFCTCPVLGGGWQPSVSVCATSASICTWLSSVCVSVGHHH
jgi:hypothetical protein